LVACAYNSVSASTLRISADGLVTRPETVFVGDSVDCDVEASTAAKNLRIFFASDDDAPTQQPSDIW
jgi:hypothetical protein